MWLNIHRNLCSIFSILSPCHRYSALPTKCSTYCVTGDKYSTLRQPMTSLYRHCTIATPVRNQCHTKLALELASRILCTAMKVREKKKSVSPALILKTTLLRSSSLNVVTCMIHPKWYSALKSIDCATKPPPPPPSSTFFLYDLMTL